MKNKFLSYILTLNFFLFLIPASKAQQKAQREIKIMTYNILDGYGWGKDTIREQEAEKFIASEHPDVVALEELCGFTHEKLKAFASNYGHKYYALLDNNKSGYPVGITSNEPIVIKKKMVDGLWHGMLFVSTHGINFFVLHLSPSDYKFRRKEVRIITGFMRDTLPKVSNNLNYIVLGDFNSHSPFDADLDKQHPSLLALYQKNDAKREKHKNLRNGHWDYSVISTFLSFPLIDVCQRMIAPEKRFSYPTSILIGTYRKNEEEVIATRERIDYILASPELAKRCISATIRNYGVTYSLSDHYPVIAEFKK